MRDRHPTRLRALLEPPAWFVLHALISSFLMLPPATTIAAARSLGRAYGGSPWNRRRLKRAEDNLRIAFPGWEADRVREYALGSYEHLAALAAEIAYGPRLLTEEGWIRRVELGDIAPAVRGLISSRPCVLITGHCGNWEVLGYTIAVLGFPMHALYRPLDFAPVDRWVRETRARRGLVLVDKFGAVHRLPNLVRAGAPAAFVADQNGGDRGVFVPFFNRLTSTYKSIGLLALQFNATIICGFARRLAGRSAVGADGGSDTLGRSALRADFGSESRTPRDIHYRMEVTDAFGPEEWGTHPDPLFYLTARYRRAIEIMVRRVPEQYDWLHRVWRSRPLHERSGKPFPAALREKLRLLPWITEGDLAQIEDRSARDARLLAETGATKLS